MRKASRQKYELLERRFKQHPGSEFVPLVLQCLLRSPVEISTDEMRQPFQDPHTSTAFISTDATGHFQYAIFSCGDLSCVTLTVLVLSQCCFDVI